MLTRLTVPILSLLVAPLMIVGCATTEAPKTLQNARAAYNSASGGPATELAPAELESARQALSTAEERFEDEPDSSLVGHWAYIAHRRVKIAEAIAQQRIAKKAAQKAMDEKAEILEAAASGARSKLQKKETEISNLDKAVRSERQARIQAEMRAEKAMKALKKALQVAEDARGLVITMNGEVLFETGKSQLRPTAYDKLGPLVNYLKANPEREVVVEGHTDSQGGNASNMTLSRERAESVRTYLISRGVPSTQISAIGYGEARPIASNKNATGRANNRRVEIVVKPAPVDTDVLK